MKKRIILPVAVLVIVSAVTLFFYSSNNPLSFQRLINTMKYNVLSLFAPHELTVTSAIALAPGGDVNNNGQVDAGDIVKIAYKITNTTDKAYKYTTLKTNLDRSALNFIHNVQGSEGYQDNGKTIDLPNLWIDPNRIITISFDARINYYTNIDKTISTAPQLVSQNGTILYSAPEIKVLAKRMHVSNQALPGETQLTIK